LRDVTDLDLGTLYRMVFTPIRSKLLLTGIKLKLFNQLSKPQSSDTVSKALGTNSRNTKIFLDALTAIGLLQKKKRLYRNSSLAETFLVEDSPTYFGGGLLMMHSEFSLENLLELVKEGPPLTSEKVSFSEDMLAQYATMYAISERAVDAKIMVELISDLPEFPKFSRMLDLGGGPGLIGMAIVAAHPSMSGVIFDLPQMVKIAQGYIEESGMEGRMQVLGGDAFSDSIGEGYDLVLACSSIQYFMEKLDSVVKKVYAALNSGGMFVSYYTGLTHERTKPEIRVLELLPSALTGHDTSFDQGFVADSMLRVGFRSVRSRTLNTPWGPLDLDIGKK
jgi:ubiquinone/menaquinone biosynthesis C-methylase UbiE